MRSLLLRILVILLPALPVSALATTTLQLADSERPSGSPVAGPASPAAVVAPGFYFEPNQGQFASRGDFFLRGRGYGVSLQAIGATVLPRIGSHARIATTPMAGQDNAVRVRLVDADGAARPSGEQHLRGHSGYYRGSDPEAWLSSVPHVARVRYPAVYPGIDIVYYGRGGQLEYDFVLAPHADPDQIRLRIEGAGRVGLNARGDMVLDTAAGTVTMHAPRAYQERNGVREKVASRYQLEGHDARIVLADYDRSRPLVIDPALTFAGYLGGSGDDEIRAVAVDGSGNIYVTGRTASSDLPVTTGAYQQAFAGGVTGSDAFIAKYNANGTLQYLTYLGSDSDTQPEGGRGIAVGPNGTVYVTGIASRGLYGFPVTTDAYASCDQNQDAFLAVLDSSGAPDYITCIVGSGSMLGEGIAVDSSGNAYITGLSYTVPNPAPDAFFLKLNPAVAGTSGLVFTSTLGGSELDEARGIALDTNGNIYLAGRTASTNFPVMNAAQATFGGGASDAFVAKISADGAQLLYSSFLGGTGAEEGNAIAVDGTGNAFVTGWTASSDFLATTQDTTLGGSRDAFVAKYTSSGALGYARYLGGNGFDEGRGIAGDGAGGVYVTGGAASTDFAANGSGAAGSDAFLSRLGSTGAAIYSIPLAGSGADATGDDQGEAVAADAQGNVYVAGWTTSSDFPVFPSGNSAPSGNTDGFVARIGPFADLSLAGTRTYNQSIYTYSMTVTNNGPDLATGVKVTDTLPFGVSANTWDPSCSTDQFSIHCDLGSIAAHAHIAVSFSVIATATAITNNFVSVSGNEADTVLSNNTTKPSSGSGDETPVITINPPSAGDSSGGGGGGGAFGPLLVWLCAIRLFRIRHRCPDSATSSG